MSVRCGKLSDYPYVVVRVACVGCRRRGAYRLARLAAAFGPECSLDRVLEELSRDCGYRLERRGRYSHECKVMLPDLQPPSLPPDVPADMRTLRVVNGDKA